jgi:uncharacterized membrane protein
VESQEAINRREWEDPANWRGWLCIYRGARDTRVWVPKRNRKFGVTINFAHPAAWWNLLGIMSVPLGFLLLFVLLQLAR